MIWNKLNSKLNPNRKLDISETISINILHYIEDIKHTVKVMLIKNRPSLYLSLFSRELTVTQDY